MTPEREKRVRSVAAAASEREESQRDAFLDGACSDNPALRRDVEFFLARGSGVESPAVPTITSDASELLKAATPVLVGRTVSHFDIVEELGRGGMGIVYRARDVKLGRSVAVKFLSATSSVEPERLRRFEQEARATSALNHPNIVTIHEVGDVDGIPYIVMELVQGRTLRIVLEAGLAQGKVLDFSCQIADGLSKAHDAGIVHRDLKPENMMVTDDGFLKILDFGLAKLQPPPHQSFESSENAPTATRAGVVVGTVGYMSPEQASGRVVDHRSDQFSFGCILYELLSGKRPFQRDTAVQVLSAIIESEPEPLANVNPAVPRSLDSIVTRCLSKAPEARYESTRDLAKALREVRDELAETATRSDMNVRVPVLRRTVSVPRWPAFVLALLALIAVGVAAGNWIWSSVFVEPGSSADIATTDEPISVLIADFDNRTGEPVFDGALEQAMNISLEEARFLSTFNRGDARDIANQLAPDQNLDEEAARLVSRREGIKIVVTGSIERDGSRYRLRATALDPGVNELDEAAIASETTTAADKGEVLQAVSTLARGIRTALGDTTPASASLNAAETFSAGSLEAMSAYARGQELYYEGRMEAAIESYGEAVELDPAMGRAFAGMATAYAGLGRSADSEAAYQNALKYVDRMTEREKYRTLGGYYLLVANNYEKAIENYEALVERYPADNAAYANLALAYLKVRNTSRAVEEGRRAVEMYPGSALLRANYAMYCMYAGDFETAISQANTVLASTEDEYALLTLALSNAATGDLDAGRAAYERLGNASRFGGSWRSMGLADLAMVEGRHGRAIELLSSGIVADREDERLDNLALKYVALAEAQLAVGERSSAARSAREAATLSRHESVLFPAASVLIQLDQREDAERLANVLESHIQNPVRSYASLVEAELARVDGDFPGAIDHVRAGRERHDSWLSRYLLGALYVEAGHYAEALAELELCERRLGETTDVFIADSPSLRYLPPLYYWLARSQEGLGATSGARQSYERYLELRQGADPPDPLASDAVRRLAELPAS